MDIRKHSWDEEGIECAMRNAAGSLAVDGFYLTPEEMELVRRKLRGEITEEEFMKQAWIIVKKKK